MKFIQKIIILFALIITLVIYMLHTSTKIKHGTVIILNGTSSVGKSTIQKKVQELFNEPYLRMGLDDLAFLPDNYISINGPVAPADKGIYLETKEIGGHKVVYINYGEVAQKMMRGIHRTFAAFASSGNNIIIDYILYDPMWLKDLTNVLKDYKVYFIGVHSPLEIIEQREKERGNRLLGHARSHYNTVHKNLIYDLELDSSKLTPEESALEIKKYIAENPKPLAFKKNY
ncbi:MAG: AAA family ATPase [Candidatus Babeliales bacterium]|nr:AAA family ATPase [Candidatus Babeliales bacterium]